METLISNRNVIPTVYVTRNYFTVIRINATTSWVYLIRLDRIKLDSNFSAFSMELFN